MGHGGLTIELIGGSTYPLGSKRYLKQTENWGRMIALAPRLLAAITPNHHHVKIKDFREIKHPDPTVDVVGISYTTTMAGAANRLADQYRERGVFTVAGGVHASLMPRDALKHFDTVVVGPGELVWPQVLNDFEIGQPQRVYYGRQPATMPIAVRTRPGGIYNFDQVEITRGCANFCGDWCSVPYYYGRGVYLTRPVEEVLAELSTLGQNIMLYDNSLVSRIYYARELFTRMIPLKKRWVGSATLWTFQKYPWLASLMKESGCLALLIGFESLEPKNLQVGSKRVTDYQEGVSILHDAGIGIEGSFVIGLPFDTPASLEAIPEFALKNRLEFPTVQIATPFPGTGFYQRMEAEGRLLTTDWSLYDAEHVVFRPDKMTPDQLRGYYDQLNRDIFSLSSIVRRSLFGEMDPLIVGAGNVLTRASFELGQVARSFGLAR